MLRPLRSLIIMVVITGLLVPFFFALAHQPRLVPSTPTTFQITNPDVSQAFYGTLSGTPDLYSISSNKPFHLYASILIPDIANTEKDIFVIATDDKTQSVVFTLNGAIGSWERFYEPFGGDWYLQGPKIELDVPEGIYHITITSADNEGKYVLSTGKDELFPFREIVHAFITIPQIKLFYFDKSIVATLLSPWGIATIIISILFSLLVYYIVLFALHYSLGKRFMSFCSVLYYRYIRKVG